ncbi:unnamed protein product [Urochloa humidicola]
MLDLNSKPPFDWDELGEWEGPAHELDYDLVWSGEEHEEDNDEGEVGLPQDGDEGGVSVDGIESSVGVVQEAGVTLDGVEGAQDQNADQEGGLTHEEIHQGNQPAIGSRWLLASKYNCCRTGSVRGRDQPRLEEISTEN